MRFEHAAAYVMGIGLLVALMLSICRAGAVRSS